jgi:drug/metabolite transporter (DMT)-like permease
MWLLLLASIWGASYMLIKIGLRDLSAPMVAWMRIALAAGVLVPWAASLGALGSVRGRSGTVVLVGAVQVAAPFLLIALGEEEISSALAGILVATAPIFTAVLAIWVDHEEVPAPPCSAASPSCWRAWGMRWAASWSNTGLAMRRRSGSPPG